MLLRDFTRLLKEGGNLGSHKDDGSPMPGWQGIPGQHQAQQIDLKVHNRAYIVPILDTLLNGINAGFQQSAGGPLWSPKVLKSRKYLSGSSLHFFNTDIPDDEFERVKPKVGDIDTQINKASEGHLEQWLNSVQGKIVGNAKFVGFSRGNEQFSSLWELTDPPIKVQIDFEFVDYDEKKQPTDWAGFSHSSSWDDMGQGIKGVFHKYLIQSFTRLTSQDFLLRKMVGRGKAREEQNVPTTDNMFSFAVSSKEGGGLRPKYEPALDEKGRPLEVNGLPVMRALPASGYEKDIGSIFQNIFGKRIDNGTLKKVLPKTWSFTGLLELMNLVLPPEEKEQVLDAFVDKLFSRGAQGLYKGDAQRDVQEKNTALNYAIKILGVTPPSNLEHMRQEYIQNYKSTTEGAIGLDEANDEAPQVKAQFRKSMPHLRDLKGIDFLDLLDELHDGNGRFKLQNIPLNVKVDGFGGRFGKNAEGKPFMGTSRTEPRYAPGFVDYHQKKGTTDPDILGRAQLFDDLFTEMMNAVKLVDGKLGKDFLINKQVTCEVLFLPFATETEEGKLKFVGIAYDKLPKGVQLALVPFRVVDAQTGDDLPNSQEFIKELLSVGKGGSVMFIDNSLKQKDGLDVTEIINPLENLDELKRIISDTHGKRDRASLQLRKEVEEKLQPVKLALEKAIISDPNILGKDLLGKDYEGIVINTRLGPVKVTSAEQKQIIATKNAAKAAARTDQGRGNSNKTAVVAIGSFVGHRGHEELFNYTIKKAKQVGGDAYLFMGNAVGKDDPIPVDVKLQTWHKMYPSYTKNISATMAGGTLMQKIKHELINPLPGKPPRYDNIIIMVGEDQASMPIAEALMKAVNKFPGYEHVKVSLEVTPRGTGMSFTKLRNILKDPNATPEQQYSVWSQGFDEAKLGKDWILHLMDITRKGMGIQQPKQQPKQQPSPEPKPVAERLFNSLVRTKKITEDEEVRKLQQLLISKGAKIDADGIMGPRTQLAMKQFGISGQSSAKPAVAPAPSPVSGVSKPGVEKKIAGVVKGGPGYTDVKTADGEIQRREGSRNWRNNNPGNIRKGSYSQSKGAVGDDGAFAVFPTLDAGMDAKEDLIFAPNSKYINLSIQDAMAKYAPPNENDTHGYVQKICQATGSTPDTPLSKLNPAQRDAMLKTISKQEGFKVGNIKVVSNVAEERMSAAAKLQRAFDRERSKSDASRKRGEEVMAQARLDWEKKQVAEKNKEQGVAEKMLPKSAFAGSDKNKLGPAAHAKGKQKGPVKRGQFVGGMEEEKQRLDPSCWKGYKKQGTKMKGGVRVNNCVPVSEDIQNIMDVLINKIIFNEAISNNKRRS